MTKSISSLSSFHVLNIEPAFRDWIAPLSPEELNQLEKNLLAEGCRDPIVVWTPEDRSLPVILDGHNRYSICIKHKIPFLTVEMQFPSPKEAKNWIILNQLGRRNITPEQRAYLIGKLYRETKKEQGGTGANQFTAEQSSQNGNSAKTAEVIADQFGVGKNTVIRAEKFADAVDTLADTYGDETKAAILNGSSDLTRKEVVEKASQINSGLYSSESDEWCTPAEIVERVAKVLGTIDLDPCSNPGEPNVPAGSVYTKDDDGLSQPWRGRVYMNPPYGREVKDWVEKLLTEIRIGAVAEAIVLVAARTDTRWFRSLAEQAALWCAVEGRLSFSGSRNSAPFPSAIFFFTGEQGREQTFYWAFEDLGHIYRRVEAEEMVQE